MASSLRHCSSCFPSATTSALSLARATTTHLPPAFLLPTLYTTQTRTATQSANAAKYKRKDVPASQKRKKARSNYDTPDLKDAIQFPLVDAMRYLLAAEVGRPPTSSKYELHIRLRTPKNGAVVRNRLRLPHPVKTDLRIAVICPPDSQIARAALAAGASLVGEESIFDLVKEGNISFDRCICHVDSLPKLSKAGVARTLGPRGLMPSAKTGTVVKDVASTVRDMVGGSEYRERAGVVRMAVGQLAFAPEMVQANIRALMEGVRGDIAGLSERIVKEVHEVVLSSTNGPGLSLSGEFKREGGLGTRELVAV
ncbi:mitochondrial 54S ribosomal protein MRPL1 [Zymoseptoria brevis]|uniref:Mitochondrial 54S ribosomal protein MRPL1 n=1 Tax=Zymoseptoria brevis TaxID=1047168 RepID=A0A0F4G466_9PEZI|nr:mitochondrial 54S ribosomal protein MRPL1 [Zymoseptoria brevis]